MAVPCSVLYILCYVQPRVTAVVLVAETMHGRDPVCVHVRAGACGVVEPTVLGGNLLPGCPEADSPVVRPQVRGRNVGAGFLSRLLPHA